MHGKIIQFKANVADFKVKDNEVNIHLTASTKNVVLDQLNDIAQGPLMVNLEASQTELIPQEEGKK